MSSAVDTLSETSDDLHWPRVRDWLQAHPELLADDRALLEELGLKATGRNVVEFGKAALTRLEEAAEREADARDQRQRGEQPVAAHRDAGVLGRLAAGGIGQPEGPAAAVVSIGHLVAP